MRKSPETYGDGNYPYHYSREERLKKNPRVKNAFYSEDSHCHTLPCFFKRNRGLMFLLLDVLVLLLLFWGYTLFFCASKNTLEKDGITFSLYAYGAPKGILVSFIVRAEKKPSHLKEEMNEGESILVIFHLNGKKWEHRVGIPVQEDWEQAIRVSIPETEGKEVLASFYWKGKSYTLATPIRN